MSLPPVSLDRESEQLHLETLQVVCAWLCRRGYVTSLQTLRDEAGALLRDENEQRKHLRHIGKAVDEGAWDAVQGLVRKLDLGKETRTVQFILARQQLLELVDEGDGQRAFTFFTRRIKPLEEFIGRQQFLDLAYTITCRNVQEASSTVPSLRGWSVASGRQSIFSAINATAENRAGGEFWRQTGMPQGSDLTLEKLVEQALCFQQVEAYYPEIVAALPQCQARSFIDMTAASLVPRPTRVIAKESLGPRSGVRSVLAVLDPTGGHRGALFGMDSGQVLWAPCIDLSAKDEGSRIAAQPRVVASHGGRVWAMDGSEGGAVVSVGGTTVGVMSLATGFTDVTAVQANSELTAVALVPGRNPQHFICGSVTGDVFVGKLFSGSLAALFSLSRISGNRQATYGGAVAALRPTSSGLSVFVAYRSGTIACVDISTGVSTLQLHLPAPCELLSIALSPSSFTMAATYSNSTVRLWDVISGELLPVRLTSSSVHCLTRCVFLSEKVVVASSADGSVYSWDVAAVPAVRDKDSCSPPRTGRFAETTNAAVATLLPTATVAVASGSSNPYLSDLSRFDSKQRLIVAGLNGDVTIIGI
jgi:COMPASS component SWD3